MGPRSNDGVASFAGSKAGGWGGPTRGFGRHHDVMATGHRMVMAAETWLTPTTPLLFYLFTFIFGLGKSEGC